MESIALNQIQENVDEFLKKIRNGKFLLITFEGREIGKFVPTGGVMETARKKLEQIRKTAVVEDVLSPIDEEWEAIK